MVPSLDGLPHSGKSKETVADSVKTMKSVEWRKEEGNRFCGMFHLIWASSHDPGKEWVSVHVCVFGVRVGESGRGIFQAERTA